MNSGVINKMLTQWNHGNSEANAFHPNIKLSENLRHKIFIP